MTTTHLPAEPGTRWVEHICPAPPDGTPGFRDWPVIGWRISPGSEVAVPLVLRGSVEAKEPQAVYVDGCPASAWAARAWAASCPTCVPTAGGHYREAP